MNVSMFKLILLSSLVEIRSGINSFKKHQQLDHDVGIHVSTLRRHIIDYRDINANSNPTELTDHIEYNKPRHLDTICVCLEGYFCLYFVYILPDYMSYNV